MTQSIDLMKENVDLYWSVAGLISIILMVLCGILLKKRLKEFAAIVAYIAGAANCSIFVCAAFNAQLGGSEFPFATMSALFSFIVAGAIGTFIVEPHTKRSPYKIFIGVYYFLTSTSLICMFLGV